MDYFWTISVVLGACTKLCTNTPTRMHICHRLKGQRMLIVKWGRFVACSVIHTKGITTVSQVKAAWG